MADPGRPLRHYHSMPFWYRLAESRWLCKYDIFRCRSGRDCPDEILLWAPV